MIRVRAFGSYHIDTGEPVPDINPFGTMALAWTGQTGSQGEEVVARGLIDGWRSCVFRGWLDRYSLKVAERVISYHDRPVTDEGKTVFGIEDPSPRPEGLWCTEAFYREGRSGRLGTNLILVKDDGTVVTVKRPADVAGRFCPADYFDSVFMVKEGNQLGRHSICEVNTERNGKRRSRIVVTGDMYAENDFQPYLDPVRGSWYDAHTSPGSNALPMVEGLSLLVINGAKRIRVKQDEKKAETNRWAVGLAVLNRDYQPVWISAKPIIMPPKNAPPGPAATSEPTAPGQQIAFASDARLKLTDRQNQWTLEVLFHVSDKEPWLARFHVTLV